MVNAKKEEEKPPNPLETRGKDQDVILNEVKNPSSPGHRAKSRWKMKRRFTAKTRRRKDIFICRGRNFSVFFLSESCYPGCKDFQDITKFLFMLFIL